jgi:hypothetical protein
MGKIVAFIKLHSWIVPILLITVIAALAYLPLITKLGYYGDDWMAVWGGYTQGPSKIISIYSIDRPLVGLVQSFEYRFLGDSPLHWQLYAFFMRLFGALGVYWLLNLLWPRQKLAITCMSILYVVYPGFSLMPNANTYQNLLLNVNVGLFSLILTVKAFVTERTWKKVLLICGAAFLSTCTIFLFEWMVGFEGIRFILIWYLLKKRKQESIWKLLLGAIQRMLPYAVSLILLLIAKAFFIKNVRSATNPVLLMQKYLSQPVFMTEKAILEVVKGAFESLFAAWVVPLYNLTINLQYSRILVALLIAGIGIGIFWAGIQWFHKSIVPTDSVENNLDDRSWSKKAIVLGFLMVAAALVPPVVLDRYLVLGYTLDRYLLTAMLGVVIFIVGLFFSFIHKPAHITIAVSILIGLSLVMHIGNAISYADIARARNDMWWQLSWRAPDLKEGTVVVPSLPEKYGFLDDYDIFPEVNLIYRPQEDHIMIAAQILNSDTIPAMIWKDTENRNLRTITYFRNYDYTLLLEDGFKEDVSNCLHVLDGKNLELSQNINPLASLTASLSNIDQIVVNGKAHMPQTDFFGTEPAHTWCYYYQKASLARQKGDWQEIDRLWKEVSQKGYKAGDQVEWMPFLEGYANLHQWDQAAAIAANLTDRNLTREICNNRFASIDMKPPAYDLQAYQYLQSTICGK